MGLHVFEDKLVRALRSSDDPEASGELLVYDEHGVKTYARVDSLRDAHDIAWDGTHFIVVSTLKNCLLWVSPSGEVVKTWKAPGEGDCWHINCLLQQDGRLLVSAFGRYQEHREWVHHKSKATGILFDVLDDRNVVTGLSHPHSPRSIDNGYVICDSYTRQLIEIDSRSSEVQRKAQLVGYTRGLAVTPTVYCVGESATRDAPEKSEQTACITIVSRDTFAVVDRIPMPCREVYDIVLAPKSLLPGIKSGFRANPLRLREQEQHDLFREAGVNPVRLWATGDPLPAEACRVIVSANVPDTLSAGETVEVDVKVENLGGALINSAPPNPVHISYKWIDPSLGYPIPGTEGLRASIPRALRPHAIADFKVKIRVPAVTADLNLLITLVQEHVAWFDAIDRANAFEKTVHITGPEPVEEVRMEALAVPGRK